MSQHPMTRREFVAQTGLVGAAALLPTVAAAASTIAADGPLVRRSIAAVANDPPSLASFRKGVQAMRDLAFKDPLHPFSWTFQANIHGRPGSQQSYPPFPTELYSLAKDPDADVKYRIFRDDLARKPDPDVFNQCPHGNWWFLPWHRAYLYYFERILRHLSGDPKLTLPYWNYTKEDQRELPGVFRQPTADGQPNPLFLPSVVTYLAEGGQERSFPGRSRPLNAFPDPETQLTARITHLRALEMVPFYTLSDVVGDSFGGAVSSGLIAASASGTLEQLPHNRIHTAVGGDVSTQGEIQITGLMGDVPTAARDPIFWLHHCNIDRLWEVWLSKGSGRRNPGNPEIPEEKRWLDLTFKLYDVGPDGRPRLVERPVKDFLSVTGLGYKYDDTTPPAPPETAPVVIAVHAAAPGPDGQQYRPLAVSRTGQPGSDQPKAAHAPSTGGIKLSTASSTPVPVVPVDDVAPERIRAAAMAAPGAPAARLVLSIEDIQFDKTPGVYYEVYLNLPKDEAPTPESPHYVADFGFFGLKHGHGDQHGQPKPIELRFDVGPALRRLIEGKKLDPAKLEVTFVPRTGTEPARGKQGRPGAAPGQVVATVKQVRILTR
jgi:hypothetical protein